MKTSLFRNICLLTLLLLLSLTGRASAADWAASFGGLIGANAYTQATTTDASGNTYLAGYFDGATLALGNVTLTRIGTQDAFVAKLDASGTVLWARNFGGSGASAVVKGIAVDDSGNVYLGGYFQFASLTIPALTKIGTQDAFALKLDSSGTTTWARNFGGGGATAYGNCIAVDGSGNIYLGGYFQSANFTTPALTKIGASDAFALKLDSSGTITWAKNFGGVVANAYGHGIAVDGAGNVYLGGYFSTTNLTTPALIKTGNQDAFALKLDSSGAITWARNFGGSGAYAYGNAIAIDGSGNVYLGGYFSSANLTTPALTKIGGNDAFALKLDSGGAITWGRNFGGSGANAYGRGIAVDGSGNIYLGGYFSSANLTTPALTKIGSYDAVVLKLDSSGVTTWAKNFGGSGANAQGHGIAIDGFGNVYLGGYFSSANLTTPALTKIGAQDAFTLKLDSIGAATWAKNFASTSPGNVNSYATAIDAAGNTYLAGDFNSTTLTLGNVTLTRIGTQDAFVAKFAPSGTLLWAKNFGGSGANAYGRGISVDGSGNVYFGGNFTNASLTTPALTKIGSIDAFALKLSSVGTTTWAKNFGGSGATAYFNGIAVDNSGNVYLGGYIQTANLTTPALTRIGVDDAFVLKLSSAGATTWAKNFGGSGAYAYFNGIAVDDSGNVYLGGHFRSANLTIPALTKIGTFDALTLKLDSNGATTWARNFGGSGASAYGKGIAVDASGNVYLGGDFYTANLTTPALTLIGAYDAFALKLDINGATTWARNFGGSGANTYGNAIAIDSSANVYLGGYFQSGNLTSPAMTKIGNYDAFALKISTAGVTTWARNFGGNGANTYGNAIAVDASGIVHLAGSFYNANLTTPALTKIGNIDAFVTVSRTYNAPTATTGSGSLITTTSATLNGTVNDNGAYTTVTFDYGLDTNYGNSASGGSVAANAGATLVSAAINVLTCNTTYHFRDTASNVAGSVTGNDVTFTTSACLAQTITFGSAPTIITGGSGTVSASGGSSGSPVVFSSQTPAVCTVSGANGATITGITTGTCTIAANQAGNAGYAAATQVIQSFTINPNTATLSVSILGSGGGSVNSTIPDPVGAINCASGSSSGCSYAFTNGASVTLSATPDWKSTFTGWGVPCSGSGSCLINLDGDSGVSATFAAVSRVKIPGPTPTVYSSLQDAYAHAIDGDALMILIYTFTENVNLDKAIIVYFNGGMASDYLSATDYTTLVGSLTIDQGTAVIDRLIIE